MQKRMLRCVWILVSSFSTAAVGYEDGAKKQVLGCQGLGPSVHVRTRPEKATVTCPKPKPQVAPESEGAHC